MSNICLFIKNICSKSIADIVPESCFFVSLPSYSWKFQKQLMAKSETHLGCKPLGND